MSNVNAHRPGYKHTPLGWIPEEWSVTSLGEIIEYKKGFAFKTEHYQNYGIRIIRVGDTNADGIKPVGEVYLDPSLKESYSEFELKSNDIIVQTVGSRPPLYNSMVGKTIIVPKEYEGTLLNQNAVRIREKTGNNYFLFSTLKQKRYLNYIETLIRGNANQVSITLEELFQYQILYPKSNCERLKIATILSTWDEAINKTQQLIAQLQQRNKGLMQQLLTGKKRLKGFEGEWQRLHIYDVAKEVSLKNRDDKQLTVLSCTKYDGLVPSLEYFGRRVFGNDTSTYKVVPLHHFAYATNHIEEGSIGYQSIFEEALISPMYTVFKTNGQVHDDYLFKLLKSHHYIHEYCKRMEGSIDRRGGLRWDEFSKIVIHLPAIDEQIAIASLINKAVEEVKVYEQKLETIQQQKKGLMQKLLTGEVRVKIDNTKN